jgi:hypothetical protein
MQRVRVIQRLSGPGRSGSQAEGQSNRRQPASHRHALGPTRHQKSDPPRVPPRCEMQDVPHVSVIHYGTGSDQFFRGRPEIISPRDVILCETETDRQQEFRVAAEIRDEDTKRYNLFRNDCNLFAGRHSLDEAALLLVLAPHGAQRWRGTNGPVPGRFELALQRHARSLKPGRDGFAELGQRDGQCFSVKTAGPTRRVPGGFVLWRSWRAGRASAHTPRK